MNRWLALLIIVSSIFINWRYAQPNPKAGIEMRGYKTEIKQRAVKLQTEEYIEIPKHCFNRRSICDNRMHDSNGMR